MKMIRRAVLTAITATLVLVAAPTAAGATTYPPQCIATVDDPTPGINGQFTVTVKSDPIWDNEGEEFIFSFQGSTQTTTLVNSMASATFTAPGVAGDYEGTVVHNQALCGTFKINVASGVIPPTGSNSTQTGLLISGAAVGLGGLMMAVAYRRRRQPEPEMAI